jgi:hypothetical protein
MMYSASSRSVTNGFRPDNLIGRMAQKLPRTARMMLGQEATPQSLPDNRSRPPIGGGHLFEPVGRLEPTCPP